MRKWGLAAVVWAALCAPSLAADRPRVEISVIKTGSARSVEAAALSGGSWLRQRDSVIAAVLVRHPKMTFLFDAGYGTQAPAHYGELPWWTRALIPFEQSADTAGVLRTHGLHHAVKRIYLSHVHWDHASGIEDFPHAEIWLPKEEHAFAMREEPPRVVRSQYDAPSVRWRFLALDAQPYEGFARSKDVFGDGSVVLVGLPGHTPGSLGMFVNLASGRRVFFTGDTTWLTEGFEREAPKNPISSAIVDADAEATLEAIRQVKALMQRRPEILVVPAHDDTALRQVGYFPEAMR